jgi:hypothetical protein
MKHKLSLLLVGIGGLAIGLGIGLYLRPAIKQARYIDLTNINSQWKNGDIAYLRGHGDTTSVEKYYGGKYQKHSNNIRIVTIFDPSTILWEGKGPDLPIGTIQALRQEVIRQGRHSHKEGVTPQDSSAVSVDTIIPNQ